MTTAVSSYLGTSPKAQRPGTNAVTGIVSTPIQPWRSGHVNYNPQRCFNARPKGDKHILTCIMSRYPKKQEQDTTSEKDNKKKIFVKGKKIKAEKNIINQER